MAYVFPSDAGTSCVALSVTLDTFAEMRGGGMRRLPRAPAPSPRTRRSGSTRRHRRAASSAAARRRTSSGCPSAPAGPWSAMPGCSRTPGPGSAWTTRASTPGSSPRPSTTGSPDARPATRPWPGIHRERDAHALAGLPADGVARSGSAPARLIRGALRALPAGRGPLGRGSRRLVPSDVEPSFDVKAADRAGPRRCVPLDRNHRIEVAPAGPDAPGRPSSPSRAASAPPTPRRTARRGCGSPSRTIGSKSRGDAAACASSPATMRGSQKACR